jgi:IS5 family transposase
MEGGMGERRIGEAGFADAFLGSGVGANRRLDRIGSVFDWQRFDDLLKPVRSPRGRKGYPALAMFKALLLQQWYRLSDPGLEEALSDRLSFRRFCGFSLSDTTPDETTFVRFREALVRNELSEALFEEANRQLEARGLILKTGTLMDASIVEASVSRPPRSEGDVSEQDPSAGFTRKGNKSYFGYKAHVAVDQGSGIIRDAILTGAEIAESLVADSLVQGDEKAIYADKGYENKTRRRTLRSMGIKDRIMHRSHKNQDGLPYWQKVRNALVAPIRANVERVFALMKRGYGYQRVRYRGLTRNQAHLYLLCTAINLRRTIVLLA